MIEQSITQISPNSLIWRTTESATKALQFLTVIPGSSANAAPIEIVDYDPAWPEVFAVLCQRLALVLDGLYTAIEHVGSTAVPGLAAKPIVDIDVLLKSDDLGAAIAGLASIGYQHQGDLGISGREAFRAPLDLYPHHLYVCLPGSREYARHTAFRDYLRAHRDDANAYAELKRELARRFKYDRVAYNEAKTSFVEDVLRRAGACAQELRAKAQIS